MFKRVYEYIGSKSFSMTLMKVLAAYCLYLTFLWFFGILLPGYMVWSPLVVWGVLFLANVLISLLVQKYAYTGNIIFHASFFVIAVGILISVFYRFDGKVLLIEGDTFFGERDEYVVENSRGNFDKIAPKLSFKMGEIRPEFWEDKLYFVDLSAVLKYPAETLESEGRVYLNGGMSINGTDLRIASYGFLPSIIVVKDDKMLLSGPTILRLFPPGSEDTIDIGQYNITISVYSDAKKSGENIINQSMYVKDPAFFVRIKWLGREIYSGVVGIREPVRFGNTTFMFTGINHYVYVGIVRDIGGKVVFAGFLLFVLGLGMRLFDELKRGVR